MKKIRKQLANIMICLMLGLLLAGSAFSREAQAAETSEIGYDGFEEEFIVGNECQISFATLSITGVRPYAVYLQEKGPTDQSPKTVEAGSSYREGYEYSILLMYSEVGDLQVSFRGNKATMTAAFSSYKQFRVSLGKPKVLTSVSLNNFPWPSCGDTGLSGLDQLTAGKPYSIVHYAVFDEDGDEVFQLYAETPYYAMLYIQPDSGYKLKDVSTVKIDGSHSAVDDDVSYIHSSGTMFLKVDLPEMDHEMKTSSKKATTDEDGYYIRQCACGSAEFYNIYARIHHMTLSQTVYEYDGTAKKPTVAVYDADGIEISPSNYSVTYSGNTGGTATATVTMNADSSRYSGTISQNFKVVRPSVSYRTYCQTYGWLPYLKDGATSGTVGEAKRLEGTNIYLTDKPSDSGVTYRTYCQTYGWLAWSKDGAFNGTKGEAKRLESIQIKLTGAMAAKYNIYYRVQAQKFGWLGWAKNGEKAGTQGYAYRLEAVQIKLVRKDAAQPTSSKAACMTKS